MSELIYHYTSINNLALILANKTLRLTCLATVDDMEEGKADIYGTGSEYRKMSKYFFVSCWTKEKIENIALWNMYTSNKGVRIGINVNNVVFEEDPDIGIKNIKNDNKNIIAFKISNNIEDIIYPDDDLYPSLIVDGKISEETISKIGRTKNKIWSFQKESRFVLCAMPTTQLENHEAYVSRNEIIQAEVFNQKVRPQTLSTRNIFFDQLSHDIDNNIKSEIEVESEIEESKLKYIDLEINESLWEGAEILLGFHSTPSDKLIVESLVEKYLPNSKVKIRESKLRIRNKNT